MIDRFAEYAAGKGVDTSVVGAVEKYFRGLPKKELERVTEQLLSIDVSEEEES